MILLGVHLEASASGDGSISGKVFDSETRKPLPSVNVLLRGIKAGTATDIDGTFFIGNVPAGKYDLSASMIGYEEGHNFGVEVLPDAVTNVEIELKESFFLMSQVVVTATRTNRIYANVPISTEVITAQEIEESGARDLSELLEDRVGVLPEPGVAGGKHINLLGSDSKYILILIDGEPVTGKFNDRVELDDIVTAGIERVEIVKGPASSLYGSEAMSGVINVITRSPERRREISGKTRISSNNGVELGFGFGSTLNKLNYLIRGNYYYSGADKNDPFLQIDNFSKKSLTGKASYEINPINKISFKTEYFQNEEEGRDLFLSNTTDVDRFIGEIKYELPYRSWANFDAKVRSSYYQRVFSRIANKTGEIVRSDTTTQRYYEFETNYIRESNDLLKFNFGYEISSDNLTTPRLGGDHSYTIKHQHVYAQSETRVYSRLILTAGVRFDANSNVENYTSPRAGFLFKFSDEFKLRGSWGRGFRLPSLINLFFDYYNDAVGYSVVGNPDLKPEKSDGINLGIEYYLFRKSLISLNYFQNDFEDMITDTTLKPLLFSYVNIASTTLRGIETQAKLFLSVRFTAQFSYNYLDAVNNRNGNYLPNRARHSGSVKTTFRLPSRGMKLLLKANYIGSRNQREYDVERGTFSETISTADPYTIVDADLNKKLTQHFTLAGGITNFTDYTDQRFGPWIGRKYYLSIQTNW